MGTAVGCGQRMKTQGAEASSQACRTKVRDLGPERGILRGRQPCVSLMEMREGFSRRRDGIKMYCFPLPGKKGSHSRKAVHRKSSAECTMAARWYEIVSFIEVDEIISSCNYYINNIGTTFAISLSSLKTAEFYRTEKEKIHAGFSFL